MTYSVWVWSTVEAKNVRATVSASGQGVRQAKFALCPSARGASCAVGSLPAFQAVELLVTDQIQKTALPGDQITLTVNVEGSADSSGALSPAEATIATVVGQSSSSPAPIDTEPGTLPPTVPGLPGTTVTPTGIGSLFPVITPSSTPSSPSAKPTGNAKVTKVTPTASSLPLDPRLIGGQVAGLAVLAAAITMVVARLSLRTPQVVAQSGAAAVPTAPPAPRDPAPPNPAPPNPQSPAPADAAQASAEPESGGKPE